MRSQIIEGCFAPDGAKENDKTIIHVFKICFSFATWNSPLIISLCEKY
jgi:hypothetical protein